MRFFIRFTSSFMENEKWLCLQLISGGDSRTQVDCSSQRSKYFVPLLPSPSLLSFASSTASPLTGASLNVAAAVAANEDWSGLEARLRELFRLGNETRLIFSPSGTDSQLTALSMHARDAPVVIVGCSEETGSGTSFVGSFFSCSPFGSVLTFVFSKRTTVRRS